MHKDEGGRILKATVEYAGIIRSFLDGDFSKIMSLNMNQPHGCAFSQTINSEKLSFTHKHCCTYKSDQAVASAFYDKMVSTLVEELNETVVVFQLDWAPDDTHLRLDLPCRRQPPGGTRSTPPVFAGTSNWRQSAFGKEVTLITATTNGHLCNVAHTLESLLNAVAVVMGTKIGSNFVAFSTEVVPPLADILDQCDDASRRVYNAAKTKVGNVGAESADFSRDCVLLLAGLLHRTLYWLSNDVRDELQSLRDAGDFEGYCSVLKREKLGLEGSDTWVVHRDCVSILMDNRALGLDENGARAAFALAGYDERRFDITVEALRKISAAARWRLEERDRLVAAATGRMNSKLDGFFSSAHA